MLYKIVVGLLVLFCFIQVGFAYSPLETDTQMMLVYIGTDYFTHQTVTGGDVTKNVYMNQYIPKTAISMKVCSLARLGTPLIIIGNGKGPSVMVTAGVHGNELPAQIAAMRLINYLDGKEVNGTVYIVPFLSPVGTSKNMRYWNDKNLNSNANIKNTPSNAVINICEKFGIEKLGDFHSTQPGGYPGNYSVLCSKAPQFESYTMAGYISSNSNSSLISYDVAGVDFEGAVEDVSNIRGIPAVTCEVLSPHDMATEETINRSYDQMLKFLEYCKIV